MIKPVKNIQNLALLSTANMQRDEYKSDTIRLAMNENPLGVPLGAVEAAKIGAAKGCAFPDTHGEDLQEIIGSLFGFDVNQIFLGNGIYHLLSMLFLLYLEKDDKVILPDFSEGKYEQCVIVHGGRVKKIPLKDKSNVDLPAMVSAICSKTKMIIIPNPHNPTGSVVQKRLFLQMLHRIGEDILVVVDESYIEYAEDQETPIGTDFLKDFPNLVVLRSFSHAYGLAGFGVGYGIAHSDVAEDVKKILPPYSVNTMSQSAAIAALQDKEFLKKSIRYNKIEREFLALSLKAMGLAVLPSQGNFLLADTKISSVKVCDFLKEKSILVCGGDIFGYPTAIRISIGLREENEKLVDALKILLYRERRSQEQISKS